MAQLDRADIQGNVLRGYRFPFATYTFLRIDDAASARKWLAGVIEHVTNSEPWDEKPGAALNLAFTHAGLCALGLPQASLDTFPAEFQQGMAARSRLLGDVADSDPARWELGTTAGGGCHVLAILNAGTESHLAERREWLVTGLPHAGGLTVVATQNTARLPDSREHFGYADGFSQPLVEGDGMPAAPGQGEPDGSGGWRPLKAGEFLLGHPDETGVVPPGPHPAGLARNGTYLVYRKLHQNVAVFRRFLSESSRGYPGGEEMLAAKLVGRWRDGTPIEMSPSAPAPELSAETQRNNAFTYGDDLNGYRCPLGAHVRRANPRDALPFGDKMVHRHRLIRRGMTYGDPLPPGAPDDGVERGVVFITLGASIVRQFEFVQTQWMNDGNIFVLGADRDVLVGDNDGTGKMTVQGAPPRFVANVPRMVTTRGGDYHFLPGIAALRFIAAGGRSD